jgi:hypothetical protein
MSDDGPTDGPSPAAEALELVGNEIRAEILRVLSDARRGELPPALAFSELRDRIDVQPGSSQFNYHLRRLLGTYVERREAGSAQLADEFVESEEGYALRPGGTLLTRVVTAMGPPDDVDDARTGSFDAELDCHFCGAAVRARYENRVFQLRCPGCDHLYVYTLTPPGVLADAPEPTALLDRAATYLRRKYTTFARGGCPLCANAVAPTIIEPDVVNWPGAERLEAVVRRTCDHCGNTNYALLGTELLHDPALVAFRRRHGRDAVGTRLWELPFAVTDRHTEVVSTDPWEATLTVPAGDASLTLRVDDDLTVRERSRE